MVDLSTLVIDPRCVPDEQGFEEVPEFGCRGHGRQSLHVETRAIDRSGLNAGKLKAWNHRRPQRLSALASVSFSPFSRTTVSDSELPSIPKEQPVRLNISV